MLLSLQKKSWRLLTLLLLACSEMTFFMTFLSITFFVALLVLSFLIAQKSDIDTVFFFVVFRGPTPYINILGVAEDTCYWRFWGVDPREDAWRRS